MACDRRCFEKDWKYGDINCDDCPGQDSGISEATRKELQEKLDASFHGKVKA